MTLEEFRSALHEPPPEPMNVSVDAIVAASRRRRSVRRAGGALTGVAAVGATVAVVLAVSAGLGGHPAGNTAPASGGGGAPAAQGRPAAPSKPPTDTGPAAQRVGHRVTADVPIRGGRLTFWFDRIPSPAGQGHDAAFQAGVGRPDGLVAPTLMLNEPESGATRPGFHQVWFGQAAPGLAWSVVGYYVGPAARITTTIKGRPVAAHLAQWKVRPEVHIFWITPAAGLPRTLDQPDVGPMKAYDAAGHPLTSGPPGAGQTGVG